MSDPSATTDAQSRPTTRFASDERVAALEASLSLAWLQASLREAILKEALARAHGELYEQKERMLNNERSHTARLKTLQETLAQERAENDALSQRLERMIERVAFSVVFPPTYSPIYNVPSRALQLHLGQLPRQFRRLATALRRVLMRLVKDMRRVPSGKTSLRSGLRRLRQRMVRAAHS